MDYLVVYDITDDKVRKGVVKLLERWGGKRVQKSVFFLPSLGKKELAEMKAQADEWVTEHELYYRSDNLLWLPLTAETRQKLQVTGHNEALSDALEERRTGWY